MGKAKTVKAAGPHPYHMVIGAIFVAVVLFLLVWVIVSGNLTPPVYKLLVYLIGPVIGLVAGGFAGAMVVPDSKVARFAFSATGGFAVWALFFFGTNPPKEGFVTILLYRDDLPLREQREVAIEYAGDSQTKLAIGGKVEFRLSSNIGALDAIYVAGEKNYGDNHVKFMKSGQVVRVQLAPFGTEIPPPWDSGDIPNVDDTFAGMIA